jgi:hypothetical protein
LPRGQNPLRQGQQTLEVSGTIIVTIKNMQEVQLDTSPPRIPTSSGTSKIAKNDHLLGPHKSVVHMKRIYKVQLYKCYILSFKTPFDIFI